MAKVAIIFGIALVLLGVVGYFSADADHRSVTAFIPAFVGAPLVLCGVIAMNPAVRKHAMHFAAVLGLLGFIAPLGRLIPQMAKGNMPTGAAGISQIAMFDQNRWMRTRLAVGFPKTTMPSRFTLT